MVPATRGTPSFSSLFTGPRRQNTMTVDQMTMPTGTLRMLNKYTRTAVSRMPPTIVHTTRKLRFALSVFVASELGFSTEPALSYRL